MRKIFPALSVILLLSLSCTTGKMAQKNQDPSPSFNWQNANIYFLLIDRFANGEPANDTQFGRNAAQAAALRGFMGGDLQGVTQKIEEGYFDRLGTTAIWLSPVVEQIHGGVDEGSGLTYGFHGYWTKDWTRPDPNFGNEKDLEQLVNTAHNHGIRILLDAVINHTGPVTPQDPLWESWARTSPKCTYNNYHNTITCTLVDNLPDIYTESNKAVDLPPFLKEKWQKEGRLEKEMAELDAFFKRTGYPRAPRYYIIKWLCDYIRKYGIDGYRCDTAKHIEESVWADFAREADLALEDWKRNHPSKVLDSNSFYMVGEVYGYNLSAGRLYDFGDRKVDYFSQGFDALINFRTIHDAQSSSYEAMFSNYDNLLRIELPGKSVLHYLDSHDDGNPFDKKRAKPLEQGTRLLLSPGAVQVYYGDESARPLDIPGTKGDATLRSFMNWEELKTETARSGYTVQEVLAHYQKLGLFRKAHPAIGAGRHFMLSVKPYIFERTYTSGSLTDAVVVGLELPKGPKTITVGTAFKEGTELTDTYSGQKAVVTNGKVSLDTPWPIVLLGK